MGGFHSWPDPPAGPSVVCKCGHDLAAHTGSGVAGVPCKICGAFRERVWPGKCVGWDPPNRGEERDAHDLHDSQQRGSRSAGAHVTGPAGATTPPGPPAGPPDLDHAIHAATDAFDRELRQRSLDAPDIIRITIQAAWPHIRAIQAEAAALRHLHALEHDLTREQDQTITALRDRLAAAENEIAANEEVIGILGDDLQQLRNQHDDLQRRHTELGGTIREWNAECIRLERERDEREAWWRSVLIRKDPRYEQAIREAFENPGEPMTVDEFLAELAALDQAASGETTQ
jgi:hypothetical protein